MSNFLNKYVAIKKYNSYSKKSEIIRAVRIAAKGRMWALSLGQEHWNIWQAEVKLKLSFSSENEAKNPAIAVQHLGQIGKEIEMAQRKGISFFFFFKIIISPDQWMCT